MRFVVRHDGHDRAVEVDADLRTPVAVVARSLGGPTTTELVVDGRPVPGDTPVALAGLRQGATLCPVAPHRPHPSLPSASSDHADPATVRTDAGAPAAVVVELHVTGGIDAGDRHRLAPGVHVIGRERTADVVVAGTTVSAHHARLTVAPDGACTVEDLRSRNGTVVEGSLAVRPVALRPGEVLAVGAVQLQLRPLRAAGPGAPVPPPGATTVPFNRPPRPLPPPAPAAVPVPGAPASPAGGSGFAWAAVLTPLVLGLALAALVDPRMALFVLLSPVMAVASWAEDRRRTRRGGRRAAAAHRDATDRFRRDLHTAVAAVRAHRDHLLTDPAEAVARATTADPRLWERRRGASDLLRLRVGVGTDPLPVALELPADAPTDLVAEAAEATRTRSAVACDLAGGRTLGIVGDRRAVLPVLRWLVVAAAVDHGPADLRICVLTDRPEAWTFATWLPHTAAPARGGVRLLGGSPADHARVLAEVARTAADPDGPTVLVVVDAPGLTQGRDAPARDLLRGERVSGVVATTRAADLPDVCRERLTLRGDDGAAVYERLDAGAEVADLLTVGVGVATAERVARALAGLDDPEVGDVAGGLPDTVDLLPLLGLPIPTAAEVRARWQAAGGRVAAPIGRTSDGPLVLDLDRHGPHGLVAGTTGSGKSELLRTVVAALAASADPDHLNLVLIDYKGGAAFDACADLPHTVGVVTDLDDHLAARALTCLEAELRRREAQLREVGAGDLAAYLHTPGTAPLPRLLVVIDELAALTAELPEFVTALVDIAQRGRSLGVHLLLATQRPSGVVTDPVRANTDLRIALRVQDDHDSVDVVGTPDAARIGRDQPGRAFLRCGTAAPVGLQTARVTGHHRRGAAPVRVRPLTFGPAPTVHDGSADGGADGDASAPGVASRSDLERLVAACRDAAAGAPPQRRPWPDPLPEALPFAATATVETPFGTAAIGLVDRPELQRQDPLRIALGEGPVVLVGTAGSGPSEALATVALDLARRHPVDALHLHVLDLGPRGLGPLAGLPHVASHITAAERERQERLIRTLAATLEERRAHAGAGTAVAEPRIVLLIDGYATLAAAYDDVDGYRLRETLERTIAEGAPLGITTVLTADRPGAVPAVVAAAAARTLLFRLADPYDAAGYGVRTDRVPDGIPGRAVDTRTGADVQVATVPADDLARVVTTIAAATPATPTPPAGIRILPDAVSLADLGTATTGDDACWRLPVGLADDDLAPVTLDLRTGDHALVAGPARSGRSTALATVAATVTAHHPDVTVTVVAPRPSPLVDLAGVALVTDTAALAERWRALAAAPGPQLVLIDDAELVPDDAGDLLALLAAAAPRPPRRRRRTRQRPAGRVPPVAGRAPAGAARPRAAAGPGPRRWPVGDPAAPARPASLARRPRLPPARRRGGAGPGRDPVTTLADLELERVLGRGTTATVWRARWHGPCPRVVAVKRTRAGGVRRADALRHEARLLAGCDHPHVVRLLDVVEDGDDVALVLPLAEGGSLADRLASGSGPTVAEATRLVIAIADALGSLHRRGIVHRDVAPANVLLTSDGLPLLADLAGATAIGERPTEAIGRPGYVDPAVLAGAPPTPASDVHGVAALAYRLLSGRLPYAGADGEVTGDATPRGGAVPLGAVAPAVPGTLAAVVDAGLAADPDRRPTDGAAFAGWLRSVATDVAVPRHAAGTDPTAVDGCLPPRVSLPQPHDRRSGATRDFTPAPVAAAG